jgi:hypothetical protein
VEIRTPGTDTTVRAGPGVIVSGRVQDPDGVDTVYFEVAGAPEQFPPFVGPQDTVRFGIPITTSGLSGLKLTVIIFATDRLGNRGDTAYRVLDVK